MTKAACNLIFKIGSWSLNWRTFKALKKVGTDFDYETDWEILQLWSLYAFQVMLSNVEWIASFIPFYYYFKMIILFVTFVPGTKFANYWFEVVLIPLMHRVHRICNYDWKGFIKTEGLMLPWMLIDLFVLPGVFTTDEDIQRTRALRQKQIDESLQLSLGDNKKELNGSNKDIIVMSEKSKISSDRKSIYTDPTPGVSWSRVTASSLRLRKFSSEHRNSISIPITSTPRRITKPTPDNPRMSPIAHLKKKELGLGSPVQQLDTRTKFSPSHKFNDSIERAGILNHGVYTPLKNPDRTNIDSPLTTPENQAERLRMLVNDSFDDDITLRASRSSSLGNSMRTLITGNPSIRIRDYLFDLDLPSIPHELNVSPKLKTKRRLSMAKGDDISKFKATANSEQNDPSTLRRSGRISKLKK